MIFLFYRFPKIEAGGGPETKWSGLSHVHTHCAHPPTTATQLSLVPGEQKTFSRAVDDSILDHRQHNASTGKWK